MSMPEEAVPSTDPFEWPHGSVSHDLDLLCARIAQRRADDHHRRVVIGLVGEPGAGKSTLAGELIKAVNGAAALVPMDGFHLSNRVLEQFGRRNRKGAPDTFDAHGFVHLVRRLRYQKEDIVYAPEFLRELDEPPWHQVRHYLDTAWYVDLDSAVRLHRLAERHQSFGLTSADAQSWATTQDEANASRIRETRQRAGLIITMP